MLKLSRADHWVGLYPNKAHCTLVLMATCQDKCRLLTLAQSFSLSLIVTTLRDLRSSIRIKKFVLVIPDHQAHRLHLQLPPEIPRRERCDTLAWLIEQQGFSPISEWLWDAVPEHNDSQLEVLLCAREVQQALLQTFALSSSQLHWVADASATHPAQQDAQHLLGQHDRCGPWLSPEAFVAATAGILMARRSRHA